MRIIAISIICIFYFCSIHAQNLVHQTFNVYDENGALLENPFTGGIETAQFSEADLNNDGLKDLFVFDLTGVVNTTYLNTGNSYIFAPDYAKTFPKFTNWVYLKDYDSDGISDAFASGDYTSPNEILVYKGYFEDNILHFQEQSFANTASGSLPFYDMDGNAWTLEILSLIHPSFDDIDLDGDLDIVSFLADENHFQYYQNMSVENGWGLDSLYFVDVDDCFGGAFEDGGTAELELSETIGDCAMFQLLEDNVSKTSKLHGGYSILTLDNDGDGDKELLFGDGAFQTMNLLSNGGTTNTAHFVAQDTTFPSYATPIEDRIMPLAFYFDVTFDGEKDLIVASKISNIGNKGTALMYQNNGTSSNPDFELVESNWLMSTSIDYGKLTHPTFTDYNQDGLMDLVVASMTVRLDPNQTAASLILYENTGTLTAPEFTLADLDWLGLSSYDSYWLKPSFGDLDNDGDEDLLVGDVDGKLIYLENNAGENIPYSFENPIDEFMEIDVDFDIGNTVSPQIIDVDDDGQKDILLGTRLGVVSFFKNQGTDSNPMFNPNPNEAGNIQQLGDVSVGVNRTSVPYMVDVDGVKTLYVGSQKGEIWAYDNISGNISGTFDLLTDNWGGEDIAAGEYPSPTFVDIDRDGYLNLFVGNFRGGLLSLGTDIYVGNEIVGTEEIKIQELEIFPNPARNEIQFSISEEIEQISIFNTVGQLVEKNKDISNLLVGMYILEVRGKENIYVGRFMKE